MSAGFGCVIGLVLIPLGAMFNGYALSVLWGWFMVPVFHLPEIGIAQGGGIAIVIGMLTHQDVATADKPDSEWWVSVAQMFVRPLLSLLFGYIWQSFL